MQSELSFCSKEKKMSEEALTAQRITRVKNNPLLGFLWFMNLDNAILLENRNLKFMQFPSQTGNLECILLLC